jgi:putative ABC transport system permease protein
MNRLVDRMPVAFANLVHDRLRLLGSVAGIAFAVILMFVEIGFLYGVYDSQTLVVDKMNADLIIISDHKHGIVPKRPFPRSRLTQALGFEGVVAAYRLYVQEYRAGWKNSTAGDTHPILVFGFDPDDPVFLFPELQRQSPRLKTRDTVLIDSRSRDLYGARHAGTSAELNNHTVRIVGTFELGPDFRVDGNLLTSETTFARCFSSPRGSADELARVDFGLLKIARQADPIHVRDTLQEGLPPDVIVLTKPEFRRRVERFWGEAQPVGSVFGLGTVMGFVIGTTICYQILYSAIVDRLPQYAMLKAIGYHNSYLLTLVLQESALLSVMGYLPGLIVSLTVYRLLEATSGILMQASLMRMLLILMLTFAMCGLAAALAVRRATQSDPAELF